LCRTTRERAKLVQELVPEKEAFFLNHLENSASGSGQLGQSVVGLNPGTKVAFAFTIIRIPASREFRMAGSVQPPSTL